MSAGRRLETGGQTGAARGRHDQDALVARHEKLDQETPGHRKLPHGYAHYFTSILELAHDHRPAANPF